MTTNYTSGAAPSQPSLLKQRLVNSQKSKNMDELPQQPPTSPNIEPPAIQESVAQKAAIAIEQDDEIKKAIEAAKSARLPYVLFETGPIAGRADDVKNAIEAIERVRTKSSL